MDGAAQKDGERLLVSGATNRPQVRKYIMSDRNLVVVVGFNFLSVVFYVCIIVFFFFFFFVLVD